jgi:hypothetical protein
MTTRREIDVSSYQPIKCLAFVTVLLFASAALASDIGQWVAGQVDLATYQHYLDDLLYTHDGNNRGSGEPDHIAARANIVTTFGSFGLQVEVESFTTDYGDGYNVVATQVGTLHPDSYYVIGAHYDSVGNPGADDNASGVAGVMEIARILSQCPTEYTIKYIAFDFEEYGLYGSEAYVGDHLGDDIRGMISLDMIAHNSGPDQCEICDGSNPVGSALSAAVLAYGDGLMITGCSASGGGSDHWPFHGAGYAACLLIEPDVFSANPCYHQDCDSVDTSEYIDHEFAVKMTRSVGGFLADNGIAALPWDCNHNGIPDTDEVLADPSLDCNDNGRLDECEPFGKDDCDGNGTPDLCDIFNGASTDCQPDGIPDQCQLLPRAVNVEQCPGHAAA